MPLLDECDTLAARIGAINTIVNRKGRLVGYNTDAPGMLHALAECPGSPFESRGKESVVLGTGGAARAAAVALINDGALSVSILGRDNAHLNALLQHLRSLARQTQIGGALFGSPDAKAYLQMANLVVNATSVGLKSNDDRLLIDVSLLPEGSIVMDMVFNAGLTPLLQAARAHG